MQSSTEFIKMVKMFINPTKPTSKKLDLKDLSSLIKEVGEALKQLDEKEAEKIDFKDIPF